MLASRRASPRRLAAAVAALGASAATLPGAGSAAGVRCRLVGAGRCTVALQARAALARRLGWKRPSMCAAPDSTASGRRRRRCAHPAPAGAVVRVQRSSSAPSARGAAPGISRHACSPARWLAEDVRYPGKSRHRSPCGGRVAHFPRGV